MAAGAGSVYTRTRRPADLAMSTPARRLALVGLRLLPKHLLSRLAGRAVTWRLPPALQSLAILSEVGEIVLPAALPS